jgi:hypothetical protein
MLTPQSTSTPNSRIKRRAMKLRICWPTCDLYPGDTQHISVYSYLRGKVISHPSFFGPLDLEHLSFGLNIGQSVLVEIIALGDRLSLDSVIFVLILVEERVLEVSYRNAVAFEEPFLKLLDHGCFESGDVFVEFYDVISDQFDLLQVQLVVPLAHFLLLYQFELLLVDDVLGQFLRSLVFLLLV